MEKASTKLTHLVPVLSYCPFGCVVSRDLGLLSSHDRSVEDIILDLTPKLKGGEEILFAPSVLIHPEKEKILSKLREFRADPTLVLSSKTLKNPTFWKHAKPWLEQGGKVHHFVEPEYESSYSVLRSHVDLSSVALTLWVNSTAGLSDLIRSLSSSQRDEASVIFLLSRYPQEKGLLVDEIYVTIRELAEEYAFRAKVPNFSLNQIPRLAPLGVGTTPLIRSKFATTLDLNFYEKNWIRMGEFAKLRWLLKKLAEGMTTFSREFVSPLQKILLSLIGVKPNERPQATVKLTKEPTLAQLPVVGAPPNQKSDEALPERGTRGQGSPLVVNDVRELEH